MSIKERLCDNLHKPDEVSVMFAVTFENDSSICYLCSDCLASTLVIEPNVIVMVRKL